MNFSYRKHAAMQAWHGTIFLFLSACATVNGRPTVEMLDPLTSATLTAAKTPMVFYRDNSGQAAFARDFVSLGPIQVNTMGRLRYFLWVGAWSTGQEPDDARRRDGLESPILFVDGEPLQLDLAGWTPEAIGASQGIYVKPVASAVDAYYEVSVDLIRLLVHARDVHLRTGGASSDTYESWDDQQAAKHSFRAFFGAAGY